MDFKNLSLKIWKDWQIKIEVEVPGTSVRIGRVKIGTFDNYSTVIRKMF